MNAYPQGGGRGTWRKVGIFVHFNCPDCGVTIILRYKDAQDPHAIKPDGTVWPALKCPGPPDVSGCSFAQYIRLQGWPE